MEPLPNLTSTVMNTRFREKSEPVIEACKEAGKLVRTDIPELRRPWFAENHAISISSPLFVTVSKNGVVFYTDDTNYSLVYYRQTPLPRKLTVLSHIAAEEEDNVPDAPNKVRRDQAKWKEIGGLALCDEDCKLIVLYLGFCSIRVIANVGQLWRRPETVLHTMRLTIHGNDFNFSPFAISMCRPHSRRALITDPKNGCICLTEISEDFTVLSIIRKIVTDEIERPICCLQFTPDALTCVSCHLTNDGTGVKFLTVDDEIKVEYSFYNTDFSIGFPFGICEATNGIYVADYAKHCVYQLDITNKTFTPVIGSYDTEGQEDSPSDKVTLSHLAGIASRGDVIYIVEHPPNYQGTKRMYY